MSYEEIYKKYYLRLPKFISVFLASLFAVSGVLDVLIGTEFLFNEYEGILYFIVGDEPYTSAVLALIIWAVPALLFGFGLHFILKITFSQKVMVVDRLTQIRDKIQNKDT